jgi:hypothetical protein
MKTDELPWLPMGVGNPKSGDWIGLNYGRYHRIGRWDGVDFIFAMGPIFVVREGDPCGWLPLMYARPPETAPTDGETFLGVFERCGIVVAWWWKDDHWASTWANTDLSDSPLLRWYRLETEVPEKPEPNPLGWISTDDLAAELARRAKGGA